MTNIPRPFCCWCSNRCWRYQRHRQIQNPLASFGTKDRGRRCSSRSCTYPVYTLLEDVEIGLFSFNGLWLWDTGQFPKLPYFGMTLWSLTKVPGVAHTLPCALQGFEKPGYGIEKERIKRAKQKIRIYSSYEEDGEDDGWAGLWQRLSQPKEITDIITSSIPSTIHHFNEHFMNNDLCQGGSDFVISRILIQLLTW